MLLGAIGIVSAIVAVVEALGGSFWLLPLYFLKIIYLFS